MSYMGYDKFLGAAAVALTVSLASQAAATTVNFATDGNAAGGSVTGGPSYTTLATAGNALLGSIPAVVTHSGTNGLGVSHALDGLPGQIDALTGYETLTITFAWAVNLIDFELGLLDGNDDLAWSVNGGAFTQVGPGLTNPILVGVNYVTSFTIQALRGPGDGIFLGNDDFTLFSANIASVPVPAAGLMLLAGLGGLAAMRRRRKAA